MTELAVELYGQRVGILGETPTSFDFEADADAIARYGVGSTVLSFAVPLVANPRRGDGPLRRNFFDELLPEGRARSRLAGNARISSDYTVGMLARYGRDVAGAVKIWNPDAPEKPRTPTTQPIDREHIRKLLDEVARAPIGNTTIRRMSSLAGVQDKIVLARVDDGWAEPLDGYPSTHIIKPVTPQYRTLIFDEEFGARICRHLGLTSFDTHVEQFDGASALVIERYDRSPDSPDRRLHQEDFNQAMGFSGDGKYQDKGHPGLAAIAGLLRRRVNRTAVEELLRLTTVSVAVGNLDMHAKNISVMHLPDGTAQLAPAYDIVPQVHQPFDQNFAFEINGNAEYDRITIDDLVAEGKRWGVTDAASVVETTIAAVEEIAASEQPLPGAHHWLAQDIQRFCRNLQDGRGAGTGDGPDPTPTEFELRPLPESPGGWGGPAQTR